MYRCPQCDVTVFTPACPSCGHAPDVSDEIASGFLEFLRAGNYERPEREPPRPYRQRLASFLHCEEAELMRGNEARTSKMPLRILAPFGPYRGVRPLWFFRMILRRIHRLISRHGSESR
jgi:hypothetical protein